MVFEDRVAKYPGRWTMVKADGTSEIVTLVRNDEPSVEGTPINASTLNELSTVAGALNAATEAKESAAQSLASEKAAAASQTASGQSAAAAKASADAAAKSAKDAAAAANTDTTLSISGAPADAKAVGDAIENVYGKTETYTKAEIDALLANLNVCPFEVGDVLHTTSSVSPAARFGGTWEEIAANRVLMGASSSHAAGTTVEAGLPNITGSVGRYTSKFSSGPDRQQGAFTATNGTYMNLYSSSGGYGYGTYINFNASKSDAIYGASDTVQPAAYYVHIWRRIA